MREEAIKYCIQDCISLYQVIKLFNILIFEKWKISLKIYPTLTSLSLGNYRTNYLKDFKIPMTVGKIFD